MKFQILGLSSIIGFNLDTYGIVLAVLISTILACQLLKLGDPGWLDLVSKALNLAFRLLWIVSQLS